MNPPNFTALPRSRTSNSGPKKANPAPSMVLFCLFEWGVYLTLVLLSFVLVIDDDVTPVELLWLPQLSAMMDDLWGVAVAVFQLWMFMVVFLIMLPAMCGLSLGVTGVYIQILVKILEVVKWNLSSDFYRIALVLYCWLWFYFASRHVYWILRNSATWTIVLVFSQELFCVQWATVRIQRGRQEQPSVPVPLPNGEFRWTVATQNKNTW